MCLNKSRSNAKSILLRGSCRPSTLFIVFGTSSRLKAALQSDTQIPWEGGFALLVIDEVVSPINGLTYGNLGYGPTYRDRTIDGTH